MMPRMSSTPALSRKVSQTYARPFSSKVNATGLANIGSAAQRLTFKPGATWNFLMASSASSEAGATKGFLELGARST